MGIDAGHGEVNPGAAVLAVTELTCSLVGEEREVISVAGTRLAAIVGDAAFLGSHSCRFGANTDLLAQMAEHGLQANAWTGDGICEGVELDDHPFFIATLFQPQMQPEVPTQLHPLLAAWGDAAARG